MLTPQLSLPICSICKKPVQLETSKTDEDGMAVHEDCYVSKVALGESPNSPNN